MNQNIDLISTIGQSLPTSIRTERVSRESNGSTLTDESSPSSLLASPFPDQLACIDIGIHQLVKKDLESNRKRRLKNTCVICKGQNNKTIYYCNHPVCQRMYPNGCFICNPQSAKDPIRKTEAVGGADNKFTCLEIHENRFREMKLEEYRNKTRQRTNLR